MSNQLIFFKNARLIDPASDREERGGVLVRDGVIQDLGPKLKEVADAQVSECGGQVLVPGLIDMRAFIGEPGGPYRETLKSAGEAAAAGGVTTVVSMPDTSPALDDPAVIDFIVRRARDTSMVNIRPAAALTKGLQGAEMAEIGRLKEAGAIAFTDGARSVT
ncbi:MAG: dihydroorotase, partial [Microvirga sp.]|nr:dihydroorotase [Microvirga sp.]